MASLYARRFGVDLDPDTEVISTIGAKEGFSHLMWVLLQPGDAALVPSPSYPIHIWGPYFAGADARQVGVGPGQDFVENVMEAWEYGWPKPRVVVLSFPHNPTTATVEARRPAAAGRLGARARRGAGARLRVRRDRVRRLDAALDPAVRGWPRGRRRALLDDQVVLHGRLAGGVPRRQPRGGGRAGQAEEPTSTTAPSSRSRSPRPSRSTRRRGTRSR
nr:aminotransferase class I/II-fold pyridoxal phosphate-dependent enzyme [Angustibacter aerolatus]